MQPEPNRTNLSAIEFQADRLLAKSSYYEFCRAAFRELHNGSEMIENWHIRAMCKAIQNAVERWRSGTGKAKDIIINVPPGSTKSLICTVFLTPWVWLHDQSFSQLSTSYSKDIAIGHNALCRRLIHSEWYQRISGGQVVIPKDTDNKGEFMNAAGGRRFTAATGSSVTGKHADWVTVDDPQNPKMAVSEAHRKQAIEFYDHTLQTRIKQPGRSMFVIVMQRLHENDLVAHVLRNQPERYFHLSIPADEPGSCKPESLACHYRNGLFFPARFPAEFLAHQRQSMGSYAYAGQYQQRPAPEDGGILPKKWFQMYDPDSLPASLPVHFTVDTAYTANKLNDPSVIMAISVHDRKLYVRDVSRVHMEYPAFRKHLAAWVMKAGYTASSRIHIEPKAAGLPVIDDLKAHTGLNVVKDEAPKESKVTRISAQSAKIEAGRVYLPSGAPWMDTFLSEMAAFPNGLHDDQVDTLEMALRIHLRDTAINWGVW